MLWIFLARLCKRRFMKEMSMTTAGMLTRLMWDRQVRLQRLQLKVSLQGLEVLVASRMWTYFFSLLNEVFRWSEGFTVMPTLYTCHLSWPSKLGWWQRSLWVIGFMSDCLFLDELPAKAVKLHLLLVFNSYLTHSWLSKPILSPLRQSEPGSNGN